MAKRLAIETDSTPEQIAGILAASPKQKEPDYLAKLMAGQSPGVSSDDGSADYDGPMTDTDQTEAAADFILKAGTPKEPSHGQI
jgi:hypothetical protein